jgi:hypothetical protein
MDVVHTSETSDHFKVTTRRYIPEDSKLHTRCRENLKSHKVKNVEVKEQYQIEIWSRFAVLKNVDGNADINMNTVSTGLAFCLDTILLSPNCRWAQARSLPASSCQNKMLALFYRGLQCSVLGFDTMQTRHFSPEDGDSMFRRNIRVRAASKPRTSSSSAVKISNLICWRECKHFSQQHFRLTQNE